MYVKRLLDGQRVEELKDVTAILLLVMQDNGKPVCFIEGDDTEIRELFAHCATRWPMVLPYEEDTRVLFEELLMTAPFSHDDPAQRISDEFRCAGLLGPDAGEEAIRVGDGPGACVVRGSSLVAGPFLVHGITHSLFFVRQGDCMLIGQSGAGSQKNLLVFYAIERLYGAEKRELVEDLLLGLQRNQWHRMAAMMRDVPDGEIVVSLDDEANDQDG